ncbi:NAD(P)H-binding protein [Ornithinimicrobium sp. F0845]|uniref:NAD-dependent epimerase/dehydratase family protein n=1 Tax=Ornithinimicrobium sp. F0845 TaxID=2926412 RepID=UPI001FF618D3|nr:NAD-dependent epimerase/dehydratase family protein [Ornithinimicrobium sp. F0845]MCK0114189.1 NAD(P)H-binding protein [Ornithinimicrobium sp. F0845]
MRYALTGATGFVGGELAHQLRAEGHDVVALVRSPGRAAASTPRANQVAASHRAQLLRRRTAQSEVSQPTMPRTPVPTSQPMIAVRSVATVPASHCG